MDSTQRQKMISIRKELCRRSFFYFVQEFWDTIIAETPVWNWHIEYLCEEAQEICERIFKGEAKEHDLLINIPPGSTKTTIMVVMLPAWCWTRFPQMRILNTSYSASLAEEKSSLSKDVIKSDKYRELFPGVKIRADIDNRSQYKTPEGGERMSCGLKGGILGAHFHLQLHDDPLNIEEAYSDLQMNKRNASVDKLIATRKIDKEISCFIGIMQRLSELDPAGHLLRKGSTKLKHINLPATDNGKIKPAYLAINYDNGLLDPIRMSHPILDEMKVALGSYGYAAQMMQEPAPDEGGIIKKAWFVIDNWDDLVTKLKADKGEIIWHYEVDGAYTSKKENAQSAVLCWGMYNNIMYIREVIGVWEEMPDFVSTLPSFVQRTGYTSSSKIYIEDKATGLPVIQTLKRETNLNVMATSVKGDKIARVHSAVPFIESGRCHIIKGDWNDDFIHQCAVFPNGRLKDKVDCLTAAVNRVTEEANKIQSWGVVG